MRGGQRGAVGGGPSDAVRGGAGDQRDPPADGSAPGDDSPGVELVDAAELLAAGAGVEASQYGRMGLVLVRRIFRGLNNARLLRAEQGQSRIRPWRTSHA